MWRTTEEGLGGCCEREWGPVLEKYQGINVKGLKSVKTWTYLKAIGLAKRFVGFFSVKWL